MNIGDERLINVMDGNEELNKLSEDYEKGAPEEVAKEMNEEVKKLKSQKPPTKDEIANFRVSSILKGPIRLKDEDFDVYKNRMKFENKIKKIYLRGKPYEENTSESISAS